MISRLSILSIALLLSACGGKDQPPAQAAYAQNAAPNGYCSPAVLEGWRTQVASQCQFVQDYFQANRCRGGVEGFRQQNPGVNCQASLQDAQWAPENERSGLVRINEHTLQHILRRFEWDRR